MDAPATATPSPTPSPTQTPTATPSQPSQPSAPPVDSGSTDDASNPFTSQLDAAFEKGRSDLKPKDAKEVSKDPPRAKPEARKATPEPKVEQKPEPPKDAPREPKQLREELDRVNGKVHDYEAKIKDYEARGKDTEALQARLKDMEALQSRLEQRDKEFEAAQAELRALKRESSPEFKKQYLEPFQRTYDYAREVAGTMERADGQKADFDRDVAPIYELMKTSYGRAAQLAKETFGDELYQPVLGLASELVKQARIYERAFNEEQKNWQEKLKAEEGQRVQRQEQMKQAWNKLNEDLINSVEDYRDPADDAELAEARTKAIAVYDAAPRSEKEHLLKQAHIRHMVGSYQPLKLKIARLQAKLDEATAKLEEHKPRQPMADGQRRPGGTQPEKKSNSFDPAELMEVVSKA
jgi:hypothetical protein